MTNIRPEGKCPVCFNSFKFDKRRGFICPTHLTTPQRYVIRPFYKGERITRGTTFDGKTIRTLADALTLLRQFKDEKDRRILDITKWKSKLKIEYAFKHLIWKWYQEKEDLMNRGKLARGYVPKLRTYITNYYEPFFKGMDVREILSCKDFARQLNKSPKYQKNILDALCCFFRWLRDEERLIQTIPVFPKIEVPEYEPQTASKDVRLAFLQLISENEPEHVPVFTYLIHQGCRPSEARALMGDCIEGDQVAYRRNFSGRRLVEHTKTKRIRYNYLFPETRAVLPRVFPKQFVFTHGSGRPYSQDFLNEIYKRTLQRFNEKYGTALDMPLYEFTKHSFGTEFINAHPEHEKLLQEWFGHTKPEMTRRYAKLKVVDAFRKLDNVKRIGSEWVVGGGKNPLKNNPVGGFDSHTLPPETWPILLLLSRK